MPLTLILLVIVVALSMWMLLRVSRPVREEAHKLTAEQARLFHRKYRKPANRTDMPDDFKAIAEASDRARSVAVSACAASAASIAAYILLGG